MRTLAFKSHITAPLAHSLLIGCCLLLLAVPSMVTSSQSMYRNDLPNAFSNEGWTLQLAADGLEIYTRKWPGSDFVAVKASQRVEAPLSTIVANYLDVAAFPEWVKDMAEAREITPLDAERERLVYMRMDMPWPLQDRDIVAAQRYRQLPDNKVVKIREWHAGDALPKVDGVVRVPRTNMELILVPESKSTTRMIFQGHNDPGGIIPSFLVNWMIEDVFYVSMLNMRERFESPAHQHELSWIDNYGR